jgi:hypothetical protein
MIDIDKCMDWWKNNRAEYKCNMGQFRGQDAEEELINTLYAEVKRLREQLAKANKYVHTICQHSDSMLMDYEDYMKGDEQE